VSCKCAYSEKLRHFAVFLSYHEKAYFLKSGYNMGDNFSAAQAQAGQPPGGASFSRTQAVLRTLLSLAGAFFLSSLIATGFMLVAGSVIAGPDSNSIPAQYFSVAILIFVAIVGYTQMWFAIPAAVLMFAAPKVKVARNGWLYAGLVSAALMLANAYRRNEWATTQNSSSVVMMVPTAFVFGASFWYLSRRIGQRFGV